jgi:hypothetical protein
VTITLREEVAQLRHIADALVEGTTPHLPMSLRRPLIELRSRLRGVEMSLAEEAPLLGTYGTVEAVIREYVYRDSARWRMDVRLNGNGHPITLYAEQPEPPFQAGDVLTISFRKRDA